MAETYPLPPDPALAALTAALNDAGHWAEVVDEHWNWVFITDDLRKSYGKPGTPAEFPLGTFYFGPEAEASRTRVVGGFPDGNSALMLVCARIRYVTANEWSTRRYLDMSRFDDNLVEAN